MLVEQQDVVSRELEAEDFQSGLLAARQLADEAGAELLLLPHEMEAPLGV